MFVSSIVRVGQASECFVFAKQSQAKCRSFWEDSALNYTTLIMDQMEYFFSRIHPRRCTNHIEERARKTKPQVGITANIGWQLSYCTKA
jgi:hypothetical protein